MRILPSHSARHAFTMLIGCLAFAGPLHAVISFHPEQAFRNTGPTPEIDFFEFQADYGHGLVTAITPRHVVGPDRLFDPEITTIHFPSGLNEGTYQIINTIQLPHFNIFEVDRPINRWIEPNFGRPEEGQIAMLTGRGEPVGDPVYFHNELRGWKWGEPDGVRSWAWAEVRRANDYAPFIFFKFESWQGKPGAHNTDGDIGGASFIFDNGRWKLIGLNNFSNRTWAIPGTGIEFPASIFNGEGMAFMDIDGIMLRPFASHSFAMSPRYSQAQFKQVLVTGDLNFDGSIDSADLEAFIAMYQSGGFEWFYDLNGNGILDWDDWRILFEDKAGLRLGDVNQDGIVDDYDIQQILASGKLFADTTDATWLDGDINLDGRVDHLDLQWLLTAFEADRHLANHSLSIPEPTGAVLFAAILCPALLRRSRPEAAHG